MVNKGLFFSKGVLYLFVCLCFLLGRLLMSRCFSWWIGCCLDVCVYVSERHAAPTQREKTKEDTYLRTEEKKKEKKGKCRDAYTSGKLLISAFIHAYAQNLVLFLSTVAFAVCMYV